MAPPHSKYQDRVQTGGRWSPGESATQPKWSTLDTEAGHTKADGYRISDKRTAWAKAQQGRRAAQVVWTVK